MAHFLKLLGLFMVLLTFNSCIPATSQETLVVSSETSTTVQYAPSSENVANPERGYYQQLSPFWLGEDYAPLELNDLRQLRQQGISMVRTYYIIDEFIDRPLSEEALNRIWADFVTVREAGLKIIPRFAYNFPRDAEELQPDASLDRVLRHIDQLAPILQNNADVIAFLEAGFIGAWGEWHTSKSGLVSNRKDDNPTINEASRQILTKLLDTLPLNRMIALRSPINKRFIFGDQPLGKDEAFTATHKARIGHHNDCFLASETDAGTYPRDAIEAEKNYLSQENRFLPQGGETCRANGIAEPYVPCNNALKDLARMRYTTLNIDYHPDVNRMWQYQGCLEDIKRRLGYRFRLLEATVPRQAQAGGAFNLALTLKNEGFGGLYNPRMLEVVLRNTQSGEVHSIDVTSQADPRFWLPGSDISLDLNVNLSGVPAGQYKVLLHLPDPELYGRTEYAIRLANKDVWEEATGFNNLLATLEVQ
jgi:Domain of unknown function (DUF4832)/Domain of unknown function (DUF4874)